MKVKEKKVKKVKELILMPKSLLLDQIKFDYASNMNDSRLTVRATQHTLYHILAAVSFLCLFRRL